MMKLEQATILAEQEIARRVAASDKLKQFQFEPVRLHSEYPRCWVFVAAETRRDFPHADAVGDCTVFNIGGNKYRLIVKIRYPKQKILIRAILTHAEYNKEGWKKDCGA